MLKRDWAGRYVRLLEEVVSGAGVVFAVGEVLRVHRNYGGLELETIRRCQHCEARWRRRMTHVPEYKVSLLPEDFVPEAEAVDHQAPRQRYLDAAERWLMENTPPGSWGWEEQEMMSLAALLESFDTGVPNNGISTG